MPREVNEWTVKFPHNLEDLGLLPMIFDRNDKRPAKEQVNDRYAHGGGYRPIDGFKFIVGDNSVGRATSIKYPGDPALEGFAFMELNDAEMVMVFPMGLVLILNRDNQSYVVIRMD